MRVSPSTGLVLVSLSLTVACGSSAFVLKQPIADQCHGAGLEGCEPLAEGVLKFVDGDKEGGRAKILEGAAANSGTKLQEFSAKLQQLKSLPGASSFAQPLDEVMSLLSTQAAAKPASASASAPCTAATGGAETTAAAQTPAPSGAAGFSFGMPVAEAKAACSEGWEEDGASFRCAGLPVPIGLPAVARLEFERDRLAVVTLDLRPAAADVGSGWRALKDALERKYGPPRDRTVTGERMQLDWSWRRGDVRVVLETDRDATTGRRMSVKYAAASSVGVEAQGL